MRAGSFNADMTVFSELAVIQQIDHARGVARAHVASLDQNRTRAHADNLFGRPAHTGFVSQLYTGHHSSFVSIRCDHVSEWNQLAHDSRYCITFDEKIAGRRHHHRVEHVISELEPSNALGHRGDDLGASEHSCFCCARVKVGCHRLDLGAHQSRRNGLPFNHSKSVLSGYRCDRTRTENAEPMKGLEVGLNACASTGIGARDSQCDMHERKMRRGNPRRILTNPSGPRRFTGEAPSGRSPRKTFTAGAEVVEVEVTLCARQKSCSCSSSTTACCVLRLESWRSRSEPAGCGLPRAGALRTSLQRRSDGFSAH